MRLREKKFIVLKDLDIPGEKKIIGYL